MTEFAHRDPRQAGFWDERFERGFTPWNHGAVPPALSDYVQCHQRRYQSPQICLIPGCGHAHELGFLLQQGWDVTAIDFSASAVDAARVLFPAYAQHIVEADFFQFSPANQVTTIYERAFLCALPPAMRSQVATRWAQLLPAKGRVIGFFFVDDDPASSKKGPPFRITSNELRELMLQDFVCLEDIAIADSLPVFEGKERWQVWERRD